MTDNVAVRSRGKELDTGADAFGTLRRSDASMARERLAEDGYVYLPGHLNRDDVLAARRDLVAHLVELGVVAADGPDDELTATGTSVTMDALARAARATPSLQQLLYAPDGVLVQTHHELLGGAIRPYDFTWVRAVGPGPGTAAHCDTVYMGRGTPDVLTTWTPLGDVDRALGGLLVLERSHRSRIIDPRYLASDVDSFCSNRYDGDWTTPEGGRNHDGDPSGALSHDHVRLRQRLGGRWLTADFHAGDVVIFGLTTVHASLDNQTGHGVRLSTDSRYQRADAPIDERWIGDEPPGHGPQSGRGTIC